MNIFINFDEKNSDSLKTKKEVESILNNLNINITQDITQSDLIISIGGDGTFLKTAGMSDEKPIVGINTGTLGFLTEISPENIENALNDISNGKYEIEERMMLEGEIIKSTGEIIEIPPALNEIAISKNMFGVVRFDAIVNGKLINSYTADGIMLCTPTGSTAYNLSCGGPIVDPTAHILTLTPIAPHTILNRSVILSDDSVVDIRITELRDNTTSYALYDGKAIEVFGGDTIRIKKSDKVTKIIKLEDRSFIDNIRENIN
ncbi:NAD(+)/NADH kinase [Methanobrevibacter sp.]|uniref:NAD(+)/NADH kinase n=1 Tax=Methanobrevibacter sp. TaxID=66852 RepID=UPI00388FBE53